MHCLTIVSGIVSACDFWIVTDSLGELGSGSIPTMEFTPHGVHPACAQHAPYTLTLSTLHTHDMQPVHSWRVPHTPSMPSSMHTAGLSRRRAGWQCLRWWELSSLLSVPRLSLQLEKKAKPIILFVSWGNFFFLEAAKAQSSWNPQALTRNHYLG